MDAQALWLTLQLAAATTIVLLILSVPLSWWIASGRGTLRAVVQALVALPLVLPPTVIGFYLLVALGPLTRPGRALAHVFGHPLAFSFEGLLLGSVLYSLPFAVQPLVTGFGQVDREYGEVAGTLGASPLRVFTSIVLPLSTPALLTAAVLTFMHTVGEFGVVLMLGGNIPGLTRTLSLSLYDAQQDGRYGEANRTALVLIALAVAALTLIYSRRRGLDA